MKRYQPTWFLLVGLVYLFVLNFIGGLVVGQEADSKAFTDEQLEFFESKVRPLLIERCNDCHGPESKPIEGSLNLSSRKSILRGGDTGPAIVPGQADESLLIDAINYGDVYEMPPDTKMSDEEIAILTKWVNDGAAWPASADVDVEVKEAFDIKARKAAHWSWKPIRKPKVPKVEDTTWPLGPIDNFVLAKLEEAELAPASDAPKLKLIRRAYFDLIGLPPTPDQVEKFLKDESETAFEKVIDELLASPRFGERWARHWMDLTRYAETGGHEFDYVIHHAHEYRDYLIRAFNEDVSHKDLIHEHIAGDLLTNPRRHPTEDFNESILGTGFWFLGESKHAPVDSRGEEARTIDNQIDVMTKSFMGLTVACARCHDHKFDAISTEDYYALSGFLQSSRRQEVMLDPGRKIESKFNEVNKKVEKAGVYINRISKRLVDSVSEDNRAETSARVARYLDAALEVLRNDQAWNSKTVKIEGEKLNQLSVSSGETLVQSIPKRDKFSWSGDKQYWWKHGKPGDSWKLEFKMPLEVETNCNIDVVLTNAFDYGAVKISVNENVVVERLDLYSVDLQTTQVELGEVLLKPGKNQLSFELLERNEKASPSDMVGVDLLEIKTVTKSSSNDASAASIAKRDDIELDLLQRTIDGIKSIKTSKSGELEFLKKASRYTQPLDSSFAVKSEEFASVERSKMETFLAESTLFASFESGLPEDWFRTGFAFPEQTDDSDSSSRFSSTNSAVSELGSVDSGKFGNRFCGVIRSPTFELTHSNIHYRIRGENVTIRLIIDGYVMDSFNALLFKGCTLELKKSDAFAWHSQSGDIKNHLGSRAHIEVIDHGDGYFQLDEIRFSNGKAPASTSSVFNQVVEKGFESQAKFSESVSDSICGQLTRDDNPAFSAVASWLIDNDLADLFELKSKKQISSRRSPSIQKVSITTGDVASRAIEEIAKLKSIREQIAGLNKQTPKPKFALGMTDGSGEEEKIFIRGNHKTLGKVATRRFLSALSNRPLNPADGSGRKLLADKITAPVNPLTTRVAVNRIWHHLFGRGIVESVDNFGVLGKSPTHPKLLDYLAVEFSRDRQSIKRMIKRMMLTRTYQMSSTPSEASSEKDPDNQLLHRARIRRLQGEAIRDSILQVSGELDLKMFGPSVPIHLTKFMQGRGRPRKSGPLDGNGRRSIYVSVRRNFLSPMMLAFDTPIPFNAIGKRNQSNVPAQALILMNDPFVIQQADKWAQMLIKSDQSVEERIDSIYQSAVGRSPDQSELKRGSDFVKQQAAAIGIEDDDSLKHAGVWRDFCHVMFNLKEFIYIE